MALTKVTSGLISADASSVDLNIDAGTLYIDSTNNRVGIGTSSPAKKLSVKSNGGGSQLGIDIHNEGTATGDDSVISFETQGSREFTMGLDRSATSFVIAEAGDLNSNQRLIINDSGNVGIKQSSPSSPNGSTDFLHIGNSASTYSSIVLQDNNNTWEIFQNNQLSFRDGTDTRLLIDTVGNVGIGTSSPSYPLVVSRSGSGINAIFTNTTDADLGINLSSGVSLITPTTGTLAFGTSSTERMRIDSSGHKIFGKTTNSFSTVGTTVYGDATYNGLTEIVVNGHTALNINRLTSDGDLIGFYQAGSAEGSISVSGTTVSYNGGHLARWSQLSDNTKDETIVKGTVMTNLNQMAEWTTDGVTEANEQLNCMAVSSVEGDVNVAGVFVNWDEDDEVYTADMNVAMTGDMVIRIAQGVTVAQGDLLMSAGDGTAKPQDDDIIRAKTIAKVTSTHVSHTYDDGSYLVPCVLMAC